MRKITGVLAVCLSFQQAAFVAPAQAETTAPAPGPTDTSARFLRAEASLWDTFGVKVSRNGKQLGPTVFSILPDEAVAGSAEAARHVSHARVLQGFVLGFALTGVGLIAGSFALASNDNQWTQGSRLMLAGGLVAIFAQGLSAIARQTELLAAINAYNHDLVTGRLQY